jgi:hypothetical protein
LLHYRFFSQPGIGTFDLFSQPPCLSICLPMDAASANCPKW